MADLLGVKLRKTRFPEVTERNRRKGAAVRRSVIGHGAVMAPLWSRWTISPCAATWKQPARDARVLPSAELGIIQSAAFDVAKANAVEEHGMLAIVALVAMSLLRPSLVKHTLDRHLLWHRR